MDCLDQLSFFGAIPSSVKELKYAVESRQIRMISASFQ